MEILTEKHMRLLWLRMGQFYGHKWTTSYGEHDQDNTWLKGLRHITPQMIGVGIDTCIKRYPEWPPTMMEFRAMCLALPDKQAAVKMAIKGPSDDPFITKMRTLIGSWNLTHGSYHDLEIYAELAYDEASHQTQQVLLREYNKQLDHDKMQALT